MLLLIGTREEKKEKNTFVSELMNVIGCDDGWDPDRCRRLSWKLFVVGVVVVDCKNKDVSLPCSVVRFPLGCKRVSKKNTTEKANPVLGLGLF